jgi:hypothetical protein
MVTVSIFLSFYSYIYCIVCKGTEGGVGITVGFAFGLFTIYGIKEAIDRIGETVDETVRTMKRGYSTVEQSRKALALPKHR